MEESVSGCDSTGDHTRHLYATNRGLAIEKIYVNMDLIIITTVKEVTQVSWALKSLKERYIKLSFTSLPYIAIRKRVGCNIIMDQLR